MPDPTSPPAPPHVMLDIEVLSKKPGGAIIEIGAVTFDPKLGLLGNSFHRLVAPADTAIADLSTIDWHREQGTWPRDPSIPADPLATVLTDFREWAISTGAEHFWSWGSTYDFPHLDLAFELMGTPPPWRYYRCQCARTVWNLAFPGQRATDKPHGALDDCRIAVGDLVEAIRCLSIPS